MTHRPTQWDDFIGQRKLKERLRIHAVASYVRGERMPHVLLIGPPGCGKTSLAFLIASDTGHEFESFMMPIHDRLLGRLVEEFTGVVLLDEIHRATPKQQENLLTLVEDNYLQTSNGEKVYNDKLTIIGATTEGDKIIKPLYDRFPVRPIFEDYSDDEMGQIVQKFVDDYGVPLDRETVHALGIASIGVPRNARMFVQMALDLTYNNGKAPNLEEILSALQVTPEGLTAEHVRYCTMIATAGGYAGLDLMTTLMGLPPRAVVDLETELIKQGMIERQKSGRALTAKGYRLAGPLRSRRFGAAAIRESRAAAADRVESMFQGRQR